MDNRQEVSTTHTQSSEGDNAQEPRIIDVNFEVISTETPQQLQLTFDPKTLRYKPPTPVVPSDSPLLSPLSKRPLLQLPYNPTVPPSATKKLKVRPPIDKQKIRYIVLPQSGELLNYTEAVSQATQGNTNIIVPHEAIKNKQRDITCGKAERLIRKIIRVQYPQKRAWLKLQFGPSISAWVAQERASVLKDLKEARSRNNENQASLKQRAKGLIPIVQWLKT